MTNIVLDELVSDLRDDGIAMIEFPAEIAEYAEERYFRDGASPRWKHNPDYEQSIQHISFTDPVLREVFLNETILRAIWQYYDDCQPYFGNPILAVKTEPTGNPYSHKPFSLDNFMHVLKTGKRRQKQAHVHMFHTDYPSQFSYMLLVSDVTDEHPHMEFAIGGICEPSTHAVTDDIAREQSRTIMKCTGRRGTLFLFDNGNYLHRAVYREGRQRHKLQTATFRLQDFVYGRGTDPASPDDHFLASLSPLVSTALAKIT